MRIAVFDDYRMGLVEGDEIVELSLSSRVEGKLQPEEINHALGQVALAPPSSRELASAVPIPVAHVTLRAPVPTPGQILAAPLNFVEHRAEMQGPLTAGPGTAEQLGFFLKSPRSVTDPNSEILLPNLPGRRIDFEGEIAVVIGRPAVGVSPSEALDYVLGYTLVLDMTLRMTETEREERTMRKSYATFTPMGPWITTADEVGEPSDITIKAWKNGDLCQDASLADLIVNVADLVSRASHVVPLLPGDVYATGSPAGVGEVKPGDQLVVESPQIGRLEMAVGLRPW